MNCKIFTMTKMLKKCFSMRIHVVCLCYTSSTKILEMFEPSNNCFLYQMICPTMILNFFLVNKPSKFLWNFIQNSCKVLDKVFYTWNATNLSF